MKSPIPIIALLAATASAKTDFEGCTSFTSMVTVRTEIGYGNTYASVIWYDPSNLEICQGVDCGGGRAPPKTVPGCPAYSGTETVEPTFLSEDPAKPKATTTEEVVEATTTEAAAETTSTGESSSGKKEENKDSGDAEGENDENKDSGDGEDAAAGSTVKTTTAPATTTAASPSPSSSSDEKETPSATEEGSATSTDADDGAGLPTAALKMAAGVAAIVALL